MWVVSDYTLKTGSESGPVIQVPAGTALSIDEDTASDLIDRGLARQSGPDHYPRLENGVVIYAPASRGQGKQPAADAPEAPKPPPARDTKGRTAKKKASRKS